MTDEKFLGVRAAASEFLERYIESGAPEDADEMPPPGRKVEAPNFDDLHQQVDDMTKRAGALLDEAQEKLKKGSESRRQFEMQLWRDVAIEILQHIKEPQAYDKPGKWANQLLADFREAFPAD